MAFVNLPGTIVTKLDGNLAVSTPNTAPVTLVLGTAENGDTSQVFRVARLSDAMRAFGKAGTLARGLLEAAGGGAANLRLLRFGAKPARLLNIIDGQVDITTIQRDRFAGTDFEVEYASASGTLRVRRVRDQDVAITPVIVVYEAVATVVAIDTGEVIVEGTWAATDGVDIASTTDLKDVVGIVGETLSRYHDGTDGTDLSRMEMYEELHKSYELLRDQPFDLLVPMDVYLDDGNVMDMYDVDVPALPAQGDSVLYPTAGDPDDLLGKVFIQEFEGEFLFWWNFSKTDATADIFPAGLGASTATLDAFGVALTAADFHEVNFAYQVGEFCFQVSEQDQECHATVGVKPPLSTSLRDLAAWVGKMPVFDAETEIITTNGSGLLGNKFMSGRLTDGTLPGHFIDGIDGKLHGGFIHTDSGFIDGFQQEDANEKLVDNGKYLSVLSAQPLFSNAVSPSYTSSAAAVYAGMISDLPVESAPTNKVISSVGLTFNLNISKVDILAGQRYVHFHSKPKGVVVADAPTASRPGSDYTRLTTNRIVKAAVDAVRLVSDPFLGEGLSGAKMSALDTAQEQVLTKLQKGGVLKRYSKVLSATPEQAVLGQASVELTLVPAFELRQITVTVSLARA
jgi:hypothetical protein